MPLYTTVFVMEVTDTEPPNFYGPAHRTVSAEAPGDHTINEYWATAGAGVVALRSRLSDLDDEVSAKLLACILPHYEAAVAAPCGVAAVPAINDLYDELLAAWTDNLRESAVVTNMVVTGPAGPFYLGVHAFVCARPQV